MIEVYLVRHGETDYNRLGKIQGRMNIVLNNRGRRQIRELREILKDVNFDICFSSPLSRTMETAMILVGERVLINTDSRLLERDFGLLEGQPFSKYDAHKYWDYYLNYSDDGVEKIQDIFKRVISFIDYLRENYQYKTVLIVSHEATIRAIYHVLNHTDLSSRLLDFKMGNGHVQKMIIK